MQKISTLLILFFLLSFTLSAQKNLEFMSQQPFTAEISDVWGYAADDGREYAIVGKKNGTAIVDVTDPEVPVELYVVPDGFSVWRDIKTHNGYAYIVDDQAGAGMLIIDMTSAPDTFTHTYWYGWPNCNGAQQSHNIFIDEQGFAYLTGAACGLADFENNVFENYSYGMLILDLNQDPLDPPVVSIYDNDPLETIDGTYVHDCYVRNDTAWLAQIYTGTLVVMDVSDKSNLTILGSVSTSSNFTHNVWLSDDGKTVFTTDEVSGAFIDAYDVSDLSDIQFLDKIQSNPGSGVIPHNTYVVGDFLVTSYYCDGITIHDASRPNHLVQVGDYDTSPNFSGNGFDGAWGVYPYLPSGNILAADIQEGLYVLKPTYQNASFLDVTVVNQNGDPISNVPITILETGESTQSNLLGLAVIGSCSEGEVTVLVDGEENATATISSGGITELTITLQAFDFALNIQDLMGNPVPNPSVVVSNSNILLDNTGDENGGVVVSNILQGGYDISVGAWGYEAFATSTFIDLETEETTYYVTPGYYDDFSFDYNWTVSGDAESGVWERAVPESTSFQGIAFNVEADVDTDSGNQCFVTGNLGGSPLNDAVSGTTTLTSPSFDLSDYNDPFINFKTWFTAVTDNVSLSDDFLSVSLDNGTDVVLLEDIAPDFFEIGEWIDRTYRVTDFMALSADMRFVITASNFDENHIVEAGIDQFNIYDAAPTTYSLAGSVANEANVGFANTLISITNQNGEVFTTMTDANGAFQLEDLPAGVYNVGTGVWGYTNYLEYIPLSENSESVTIQLQELYTDNFNDDLGWAVSGDNTGATWELGTPEETMQGGTSYNPSNDAPQDAGNSCYTTGLMAGENVNANDTDAGEITLSSPSFDVSAYANPRVSFQKWFANNGDDELVISISNGIETVVVETVVNQMGWTVTDFAIQDFLEVTGGIIISFTTEDKGDDHILEAGIDNFFVYDTNATGLGDLDLGITILPNPVKDVLRIEIEDISETVEDRIVIVTDINGKELMRQNLDLSNTIDFSEMPRGMYVVSLELDGIKTYTTKIVK